jgi:hypothetical protein
VQVRPLHRVGGAAIRVEGMRGVAEATMTSPENKNYEEIVRLEERLRELRSSPSALGETEALREARLEIALAVREVGAMLTNIGWELTYPQNASAVDAGGKSA